MRPKTYGFTLVELIISMTLLGIIAVLVSVVIQQPFAAFANLRARNQLVDSADISLRRIARDLRQAVPNSVRVSNDGQVIEMLLIRAGIYYRDGIANQTEALSVGIADDEFHGLGDLTGLSGNLRLVVYNTDPNELYNAAVGLATGIITPAATAVTLTTCLARGNCIAGESAVTAFVLSAPFQFAPLGQGSPRNRLYVVESAVTYHCAAFLESDIRRYASYNLTANQPISRSSNPLASALENNILVEQVINCDFRYAPGVAQRRGVVTLDITLLEGDNRVRLLQQVQVNNIP